MNNSISHNTRMQPDPDDVTEAGLRSSLQQAYATENASDTLRQRIAALAVQHDQRRVMTGFRFPHLLSRLAAFAACATLFLIVMAWPRLTTAYTLYRMQRAILNAHTLHATTWSIGPDGSRTSWRKIWVMNSLWRIERNDSHNILLYSNGHLLSGYGGYDPTIRRPLTRPPELQWVSGISLTQTPLNTALYSLLYQANEVETFNVGGHRYIKYAWKLYYSDRPHTFIWIDTQTGLPSHIEVEGLRKGVWRLSQVSEFEFDQPVDMHKFVRR